jgi:hypothetical protein
MSFMKVAGRQMSKGEKGGDRIEELIEDGDKALKGLPSKSSQQSGPDPKALKDAFLETSPTFREPPTLPAERNGTHTHKHTRGTVKIYLTALHDWWAGGTCVDHRM